MGRMRGAWLAGWMFAALAATAQQTPPDAAQQAAAQQAAAQQAQTASLDDGATSPATGDATNEAGAASAEEEQLTARERYNRGLELLGATDHEAAAEAFLTARDEAGPDPTLRYRAAFNLGFALAQGVAEDAAPEQAIEQLRRSAAWFSDALRLAPPEDDDARINLELVSRRILELADQLNANDNLEARLDRLIDDQRGLRDRIRNLLADVAAEQAAAEPLGFASEFESLASRERSLMAEVGDCIDLAAEERLFIEQTPDAERTQEQQGRAYQLQGVNDYLERARQSLSDARRRLRRLEGERGHRRADAALAELKRARELLLDPLAVLRAIAGDELAVLNQTVALARSGDDQAVETPPWLTAEHLGERQESIGARVGGVLGGFEAMAAAQPGESDAEQRLTQAVEQAVPILDQSLADMRDAISALAVDQPADAAPHQQQALRGVGRAIELFADAKSLIELAYADQQGIASLLEPSAGGPASELAAADRADATFALAQENLCRLGRLESLLREERDAAAAQDAQDADSDTPLDAEAQQAGAERHRQAEELRARAQAGLETLSEEIETAPASPAARQAANESLQALDELRRLYFSIVEHLQALYADQADTHDQTATLQFEASADAAEELPKELGIVASEQSRHAQFGDAVATALARQADATQAQQPDAAGDAEDAAAQAQAAERLAEAAAEVRKAGGLMHGATALLTDAASRAATMSPELEPALDDQVAALEHLEAALQALSPPQDQSDQGQNQEQQQSESQQQAQQPQPSEQEQQEQMSQRQALRRLQAIRDREAERQRRRGSSSTPEPVEKDW